MPPEMTTQVLTEADFESTSWHARVLRGRSGGQYASDHPRWQLVVPR